MTFEQGLWTALIAGAISIVSILLDKKFFSLQFEKKIADFNFFIKKKHEVYPELFAKVMKTTNEATQNYGVSTELLKYRMDVSGVNIIHRRKLKKSSWNY